MQNMHGYHCRSMPLLACICTTPYELGLSSTEPQPLYLPPKRLVHCLIIGSPPPHILTQPSPPYPYMSQRELGAPRSLRFPHYNYPYHIRRVTHCHLLHNAEQKPAYLQNPQRSRSNAGHMPSSKNCTHPTLLYCSHISLALFRIPMQNYTYP